MQAKEKAEGFFRRRMSELQKNPALKKLLLVVEFTKEAKICQEYADQQNKQLQEEVERYKLIADNLFDQSKRIETLTKRVEEYRTWVDKLTRLFKENGFQLPIELVLELNDFIDRELLNK